VCGLSGFVCIVQVDNAPVEQALLQSLTDFLSFRGPDARDIWMDRSIGMGHALLRTTHESKNERQPLGLEERYWIAADARLDAREELIAELKREKRTAHSDAPDCELVLQAYAAWGEACLDHLKGDFSFAIWDKEGKKLFCARDHFGIKPFYYAQLGGIFLCSNTLNCIRLHPRVTGELNEAAVGDFLLFGLNCDKATTTFQDIQRLPPAHALMVSPRGQQIKRYWAPPTNGRIRYSKPGEYVENFQSILERAVADRLRADRAGILLSGGLDSSSVAAVAKELAGRSAPAAEIRGYTHVYESLIPDREGDFARETGKFLGIPLKFIVMDDVQLFERWDDPTMCSPEPVDNPFHSALFEAQRDISADCRVLFSGEGSDNLMDFQMWPYVKDLRHRGEWRLLLTDVVNYLWVRPFPWGGIRARALRVLGKDPSQPVYPPWLAREFSQRAQLSSRWKEQAELPKSWRAHPILPRGHGSMGLPQWTHLFELEDPGATGCPVETRYPFLDMRMVNFLLAIPPFPWFFKKTLLREAMAGRLPERVRTRSKTPLQGDPVLAQIQRAGNERLKKIPLSPELDHYIDRSVMTLPHAKMNPMHVDFHLRPYCFNIWLQSARRIRYNIHAEARNG
jgi:asparagine synthase (glutamine-hydrolysing)